MSEHLEQRVLNRYSREEFRSRLGEMLLRTDFYGGVLEKSYSESTKISVNATDSSLNNKESTAGQEQQINMAMTRLLNADTERTAIEAAHVYTNDDLDDPVLRDSLKTQAFYAAKLGENLKSENVDVNNILFIDNYNVPTDNEGNPLAEFNEDDLVSIVRSEGYEPSHIFYEADMVPLAHLLIKYMRDNQGLVKGDAEEPDGRMLLAHKGHELYRAGDNKVSCAMLDAALTLVKLQYLGDTAVNVLPARPSHGEFSYRGQQKKTRMIISEHLNVRVVPLINIFTGNTPEESISAGAHHTLRKPTRKKNDKS